jgi:hypothetical protein
MAGAKATIVLSRAAHLSDAVEPRQSVFAQRFEHALQALVSHGEATDAMLK